MKKRDYGLLVWSVFLALVLALLVAAVASAQPCWGRSCRRSPPRPPPRAVVTRQSWHCRAGSRQSWQACRPGETPAPMGVQGVTPTPDQ